MTRIDSSSSWHACRSSPLLCSHPSLDRVLHCKMLHSYPPRQTSCYSSYAASLHPMPFPFCPHPCLQGFRLLYTLLNPCRCLLFLQTSTRFQNHHPPHWIYPGLNCYHPRLHHHQQSHRRLFYCNHLLFQLHIRPESPGLPLSTAAYCHV